MNEKIGIFFSLLRTVIGSGTLDENARALIDDDLIAEFKHIAKKHDIVPLLAYAFEKNGISLHDTEFERETFKAMYVYEQREHENKLLYEAFESAGLRFMPLKGAVICEYYPKPWMRTSCDTDVLVTRDDFERAVSIMTDKLRYTYKTRSTHDMSLVSPTGKCIELHFTLNWFDCQKQEREILETVWEHSHKKSGHEYMYEMDDDMFAFHHISHMAKHFKLGGCGIRSFIDLWLFERAHVECGESLDLMLDKSGLLKFADVSRELSRVWFENARPRTDLGEVEKFIVYSGVSGMTDSLLIIQNMKKGGGFKSLLSRVFISYEQLSSFYPIIVSHRILTPVMHVRRWCRVILNGRFKKLVYDIKFNASVSDKNIKKAEKLFESVGLSTERNEVKKHVC